MHKKFAKQFRHPAVGVPLMCSVEYFFSWNYLLLRFCMKKKKPCAPFFWYGDTGYCCISSAGGFESWDCARESKWSYGECIVTEDR